MPSSYSASLRFTLQATGENNNTWGTILNTGAFQLIDTAIAGWTTIALTGAYTLTTALGAPDDARNAMFKFTGAGAFPVTFPAVSKKAVVWNACTGVLTLTNGSSSVTLQPGEVVNVATDGGSAFKRVQGTDFGGATLTNVGQASGLVDPTSGSQIATKNYTDNAISAAAFSMGTFGVPIAAGDAGKILTNNGAAPSWTNGESLALGSVAVDNLNKLTIKGVNFGIRLGTGATGARIEGVDYTGIGSYQPLILGGSVVSVSLSGGAAQPVATQTDIANAKAFALCWALLA